MSILQLDTPNPAIVLHLLLQPESLVATVLKTVLRKFAGQFELPAGSFDNGTIDVELGGGLLVLLLVVIVVKVVEDLPAALFVMLLMILLISLLVRLLVVVLAKLMEAAPEALLEALLA